MEREQLPLFSVIVLNYNGKRVLRPCIESILKTDYPNLEVILVDNHSDDGSIEEIETLFNNTANLRIIKNPEPLFYTGGNNIGISHARGEYLIFINNDTEVDKNWLRELNNVFQDKEVGAAQPKILYHYQPEVIDNVGGEMDLLGFGFGKGHNRKDAGQFNSVKEVFFASGVAMAVRKDLLDKVGVFDDAYIFYNEDSDLSWRIRLYGYKIKVYPKSKIFHKVSKTTVVFSKKEELAFHARKNRLATLLKNYSLLNLLFFLPLTVSIYLLMYIKELIIDKNPALAKTAVLAIKWNFDNFNYILNKRRTVQRELRRVGDWEIIKRMYKLPLIFKYGLQ